MWVKAFEWLRLFDSFAFYVSLFKQTMIDSATFILIVILWLFAFGTAFYLVSMNRSDGEVSVGDYTTEVFSSWPMNVFLGMWLLGLGEFSIDDYNKSN